MSISQAIQNKDKKLLKDTVLAAVKVYGAKRAKEEEQVTCVNGSMDMSMVVAIEKKAYWKLAVTAYTAIVNQAKNISKDADKDVEIAKLIASNNVLRTLAEPKKASSGLL